MHVHLSCHSPGKVNMDLNEIGISTSEHAVFTRVLGQGKDPSEIFIMCVETCQQSPR